MALTTYAELCTAIADWAERPDLVASVIPECVRLVETRMNRELRVRAMIVRDTITAPFADEAYENLPSDYLQLKSIRFNTDPVSQPSYATHDFIELLRRKNMHKGGAPTHYTIIAHQLLFDRIPTGADLELELAMYVLVPPLATNGTNAILQTFPDLYLFGALGQLCTYLDDDRRLTTWEAKYGNALDMAHAADRESEVSPGPLVMRSAEIF